jgi:N-methylhydantoinase A/oxoprolinase/acetone carboxylase beta subunit
LKREWPSHLLKYHPKKGLGAAVTHPNFGLSQRYGMTFRRVNETEEHPDSARFARAISSQETIDALLRSFETDSLCFELSHASRV